MPRKKRSEVDAMGIERIAEGKQEIVATLNGLPPMYLSLLADTPEQKLFLRKRSFFFGLVGKRMVSRFEMSAPPDLSAMPRHAQEAVELVTWRFLSFCDMVWAGWQPLSKALKGVRFDSVPLSSDGAEVSAVVDAPAGDDLDSPLKVAIHMMRDYALTEQAMVFGFSGLADITRYKDRQMLLKSRKASASNASKIVKDEFEKALSERYETPQSSGLEVFCYEVCRRHRGNPALKDAVRTYKKACDHHRDHAIKLTHPRSKTNSDPFCT